MQLLSQFRKTPKCNILRATCVAIFGCCKRCRKSNLILLFVTIAATTLLTLRSATSPVVATCLAMLLGPPRSQFCELLATCLAMLCSISQSESLLSSPRSSSVAVLRVTGNLSRNALLDQPIRILVILSSVLLGQSFASCCSPIAQCNTPVRATAMLRS